MGIKHLKGIEEILKGAGVPMLKLEIRNDFKLRNKYELNNDILLDSLKYLIKEKKVTVVKIKRLPERYKYKG